jgi:hypothetical protein
MAAPEAESHDKPVQIEFDAPDGCSGAQAFFNTLHSRTDRVRQASGDEARTTIFVRVTRSRGRVIGELRMVDKRGPAESRRVQGANCEDVVQALSLTAALVLDPTAMLPVGGGASSPTGSGEGDTSSASNGSTEQADANKSPGGATAEPALPPPAKPPVEPVTQTRAERPPAPAQEEPQETEHDIPVPDYELSAGGIGLAVLSGTVSPGVAVALRTIMSGEGVLRPSIGLAFAYVRNDVLRSPEAAQVKLAWAAASVCPLRLSASILTAQPCAMVMSGWLSASGRQVLYPSTVDRLWLSAGGTLRLSAWLGYGFSVELEGGLSVVMLRRRLFTTLPRNVVAETPTFSPIGGMGIAYGW